jgi:outer membrane protein
MEVFMAGLRLKCIVLVLLIGLGADLQARPTEEEEQPEEPEKSLSIGAGLIVSPRPYTDTKPKIFPVPVITARYKRFFFEGIRGGVHLLKRGRWQGSVLVQAQFKGLEPDDSPFLAGMETRKKSADGALELVYKGRPVGFRAVFLKDLLGRSNGEEFGVQAVTGAPLGPVLLLAGIGPRWLSTDRVDYYYGVRPSEATADRPAYPGEACWNWDLSVSAVTKFKGRWSLFALFNREGFGSNIKNSPLIDQNAGYSFITSLTYNF